MERLHRRYHFTEKVLHVAFPHIDSSLSDEITHKFHKQMRAGCEQTPLAFHRASWLSGHYLSALLLTLHLDNIYTPAYWIDHCNVIVLLTFLSELLATFCFKFKTYFRIGRFFWHYFFQYNRLQPHTSVKGHISFSVSVTDRKKASLQV